MDYEVWMELAKRAIDASIQVGQKFEVKIYLLVTIGNNFLGVNVVALESIFLAL